MRSNDKLPNIPPPPNHRPRIERPKTFQKIKNALTRKGAKVSVAPENTVTIHLPRPENLTPAEELEYLSIPQNLNSTAASDDYKEHKKTFDAARTLLINNQIYNNEINAAITMAKENAIKMAEKIVLLKNGEVEITNEQLLMALSSISKESRDSLTPAEEKNTPSPSLSPKRKTPAWQRINLSKESSSEDEFTEVDPDQMRLEEFMHLAEYKELTKMLDAAPSKYKNYSGLISEASRTLGSHVGTAMNHKDIVALVMSGENAPHVAQKLINLYKNNIVVNNEMRLELIANPLRPSTKEEKDAPSPTAATPDWKLRMFAKEKAPSPEEQETLMLVQEIDYLEQLENPAQMIMSKDEYGEYKEAITRGHNQLKSYHPLASNQLNKAAVVLAKEHAFEVATTLGSLTNQRQHITPELCAKLIIDTRNKHAQEKSLQSPMNK